ncbi:riboflavin synthase [Hydrogenophilus thermoluteolus]|uniref:Riboflavin synthase n=1 Tax=Hydrogenophilus thermoluteolus TaxID=297 RepID=A0A2Z6E0K8_HYDTE|nr:riboflavin synthase [Hydrogenophilus thermoluteolus]BBD78293.1 riboflavin synthase subunit alpha [Hydrogenophilus thermoluteolus]HCO77945.1 riboflavin synthase [Rhodocyclaceae bacterium]HNQ48142.1 riboflavin synthase [Hydrogenophilus thermoluteolus]HNU18927.1 riboflavin synthase [Hydrogenophilus thermoluteolus]
MFTGIVIGVGRIAAVTPLADGVRIAVDVGSLDFSDVRIGDSVAHSGVCLTVVGRRMVAGNPCLEYDVSGETLSCTTGLNEVGSRVNLEKALKVGDPLGGHWVTGHVDAVGEVVAVTPVGESTRVQFRAPPQVAPFVARKGSIAIDGVSLTVNEVEDRADGSCLFTVNLIPHTVAMTNFDRLTAGTRVNLEVDPIARYGERLLAYARHFAQTPESLPETDVLGGDGP